MALAWFICPYKRGPGPDVIRYPAMDDFTSLIRGDGGDWAETEILGNAALVKVRASSGTLTTINGAAGFLKKAGGTHTRIVFSVVGESWTSKALTKPANTTQALPLHQSPTRK